MASTSASPSMFHCSSSVFYAKGYTENMYTVSLEVHEAAAGTCCSPHIVDTPRCKENLEEKGMRRM